MTAIARDQLKSFVERVENVEAEIKDRNDDKRDIYAEAKANGFDVKVLKALIARRRQDPDKLAEFESLFELYMATLGDRPAIVQRPEPRQRRERLPREAYQPPRDELPTLGERKSAFRKGNPIDFDEQFHGGTLYFAVDELESLLKIGVTNNVEERLKTLSREAGSALRPVTTFAGNRQEELRALEAMKEWRVEGEWFDFSKTECREALEKYLDKHDPSRHARAPAPAREVASPPPKPVEPVKLVSSFDPGPVPEILRRRA